MELKPEWAWMRSVSFGLVRFVILLILAPCGAALSLRDGIQVNDKLEIAVGLMLAVLTLIVWTALAVLIASWITRKPINFCGIYANARSNTTTNPGEHSK